MFRCIKTTQRGGAEVVLRSKKPDGVLQEIWAILAVYQDCGTDLPGRHSGRG